MFLKLYENYSLNQQLFQYAKLKSQLLANLGKRFSSLRH